jgi:dihydrofolate synthase/folylpolyglutamate synthase
MIDQQFVVDFVSRNRAFSETIEPSFFELTMMMAFDYFAHQHVDVAIIEVGLGGRLDSTNIITPDVSVITNISFDHIQFLGDTLPKIAAEKAGIIKQGVPVIIGEAEDKEVRTVFLQKAKEMDAPIRFAQESGIIRSALMAEQGGWLFSTDKYNKLYGELGGACQDKNAATVLATVDVLLSLGYQISETAISNGFAHVCQLTGLQGRWQTMAQSPKTICDTAHNEGGIKYIVEQIKQEKFDKLHFVLGMVNDKDINKILSMLPTNAQYYFTKASIPRALHELELQLMALKVGLRGEAYSTVAEAVKDAQNNAAPTDFIYIGGSTFVVADALANFKS